MTRIRDTRLPTVSGGGGGSTVGGFTDAVVFELAVADSVAAQTDAAFFDIAAAYAETQAAQTDALLVEIAGLADTVPAQSDNRALIARLGATSVTQTAITGTGWVTPANAQGLDDTVVTTITGTGTTATTSAGTLTGAFVTAGTTANETATGSVNLTFFGVALTVGVLGSGSHALQYSTNGSTYTTLQTLTATTASTSYSFTITGVTLATVANLTWRVVTTVTGTTVQPSSATLDAAVVTFQTAN